MERRKTRAVLFEVVCGGRMRTIPVIAVTAIMLLGCGREAVTTQKMDMSHEAGYVATLTELTQMMKRSDADPSAILQEVRAYVSTNRQRIADEVNTLNRVLLDMSESEREAYRAKATPGVEKALAHYAEAQMALRKRMTEAQQWELGET